MVVAKEEVKVEQEVVEKEVVEEEEEAVCRACRACSQNGGPW